MDSVADKRPYWHIYPNPGVMARAAVMYIAGSAQRAITERGAFHLVLAGGSTPQEIYRLLAAQKVRWENWHIYYGDERCLPRNHQDRNDYMAEQAWLKHVGIPSAQIHPIPAEDGAEQAAAAYREILQPVSWFDLVLAGMGEDGHTASLFPGQVEPDSSVFAVSNAPKPPAQRVTLSTARLCKSRCVLVLLHGKEKHEAVQRWKNGEVLPITRIQGVKGADVLLDNAAWLGDKSG